MIERFNFYDIYGYFLPGVALLSLIWLPFGLLTHVWPAKELSSAIAAIVFAYILGHLLQTLAVNALTSQIKDSTGRRRYPSDLLLDPEDKRLSNELKAKITSLVKDSFGLDIGVGTADEVSRRRQDAFFLCRGFLIRQKLATYAEQFEGMYSMMRGFATAFAFGSFYIAGWALSLLRSDCLQVVAVVAIPAGLLVAAVNTWLLRFDQLQARRFAFDRANCCVVMISLLALGYLLGLGSDTPIGKTGVLCVISLGSLLACFRCLGAYRFFALEFAKAIWRDFSSYHLLGNGTRRSAHFE